MIPGHLQDRRTMVDIASAYLHQFTGHVYTDEYIRPQAQELVLNILMGSDFPRAPEVKIDPDFIPYSVRWQGGSHRRDT